MTTTLTVLAPAEAASRRSRAIALGDGETVYDALSRVGLVEGGACAGRGLCGKCLVKVEDVDPTTVPLTPHEALTAEQARAGLRLACQLRPAGDLTVRVINPLGAGGPIRVSTNRAPHRTRRQGQPVAVPGLAIDLGTSTIAISLVCCESGEELATATADNPQAQRAGHDVISRIAFGSSEAGLEELSGLTREALGALTEQVCAEANVPRQRIDAAVVGGNPTMLQLAAAIDPSPLGASPFELGISGGERPVRELLGLELGAQARVYLPPVVHAFVGADISAGLVAFGDDGLLGDDASATRLLVDIGTNGELVACAGGRWIATSAAAGPAFEGMGLSCGARATAGAVEAVELVGAGAHRRLALRTIGDEPARGVCGSGVIDLCAALLDCGLISPAGRLLGPDNLPEGLAPALAKGVTLLDHKPAFIFAPGAPPLTQHDVRQIQLAKGAVRTAMDLLLDELVASGAMPLARLTIAGGFGRALRPASLEAIGLIPPGAAAHVDFGGNTSLLGCVRLLCEPALRKRLERRMATVEVLELAKRSDFLQAFVDRLAFPARHQEG